MKYKNIDGMRFGRLIVNGIHHIDKDAGVYWNVICDCGNKKFVIGANLRIGKTKSCGCYNKERIKETSFKDITNKIFGKLKVIRFSEMRGESSYWYCQCECGTKLIISGNSLKIGNTKSCGCLSESYIASELKKYCYKNYGALLEYKCFRNPITNRWLPFDIYISKYNLFIEIHGTQHYKYNSHFYKTEKDFENRKRLDRLKRKYARKNGQYIEIDLRKISNIDEAIEYLNKNIVIIEQLG